MNSTRQVNPLARLKLNIVAASLVLAGSWAIMAQSPMADAHAGQTDSASTTLSESTNTTQSAPWAKEFPRNKHQADRTKHTGKTKRERHRGPQSNHRFGNRENEGHGQAPSWINHQSGDKEDNGHGQAPSWINHQSGDKEDNGHGQAPSWINHQSGDKEDNGACGCDQPHTGNAENTGPGQAPFWTKFLSGKNGNNGHEQAPQWGKQQSGDTDNTGPGQAPFWTKFLSGKNGNNGHKQASQCDKNDSGKTEKSGAHSCDQPHTGNAEDTGSGQAPFWTKFLSGKNGNNDHGQAPQWGKHDSGKTEKSGTHSCKKSCTGKSKSKDNSDSWSKDVSN